MADSIWDVVYGDNRLTNGILGLSDNYRETPKQVLGGGQSIYSPEMDDWETRYDNEGNPYKSRKDVPLHIGHSRDLSLVQPVADVLSQPVEPTVINMTNDQVVQPIQEPSPIQEPTQVFMPNDRVVPAIGEEEPIARNLSAFQEIAKFDEGGARALYDAYQKGDRISDKVFYDWMDKAGIEGVSERPSTAQMLSEIGSITAMEQAQAKERARLEELQRLEQFKPADFDPAEFDARVQRGLDKTPEWLGQSNNILSDAEREQLNTYDTDYFGNPVDTDAFGQSNFDQRQQQYIDSKNRMAFTRSDDAQPDVDMSFLYEGETVSQGKKPEPTFGDDFVGRNQRRTYEAKKFLSDALGVGGDIADTIMPMLSDTTLGILLNPQHKHHQDIKDTARNLTAGLAQGVMQDLPQGTIDFVVDGINTASNRLGKGDALDSKYWGSIWDVGFSPEEKKALGFDKSTAFGIGEVAGQLGAGYLGLRNVFKTPDTVNKALKWAKEGLSVALPAGTLDPAMGNISDFVQSTDFANAFTEFLSAKPEEQKTAEDRFVARLKTMGEELGLVFTAPALYGLVRSPAIKEFAKDMADPKTWGDAVDKGMDKFSQATTGGVVKESPNKQEMAGSSIGGKKVKPQAEIDELGFYSKAEQALLDLKQEKNAPKDVISYLKKQGVTQDELEDTGLLRMLNKSAENKEKVTKEGLLDFIGENRVRLSEEQHFGLSEGNLDEAFSEYELSDPTLSAESNGNFEVDMDSGWEWIQSEVDELKHYRIPDGDVYPQDFEGIFEQLNKINNVAYPHPNDIIRSQIQKLEDKIRPITEKYNTNKSLSETEYDKLQEISSQQAKLKASEAPRLLGGMSEEVIPDWWKPIEIAIENNDLKSLPREIRNDLNDAIENMYEARYLDYPNYEWTLPDGYKAYGNEDIGISIYSPDNRQVGGEIYSINEANIVLRDHLYDEGVILRGDTLYSEYTQPGLKGETYREIPIIGQLKGQKDFLGAHMDEENVVAWLRTSDRTDVEGNKVLFVEEVQSDWHQQGRKRGYNKITQEQAEEIKRKIKEIEDRYIRNAEIDGNTELVEKFKDEVAKMRGQLADIDYHVPDAPLKDNKWQEMAVARAIKIASDEGYDRVAFSSSHQQLNNWNPSRSLDEKGKVRYKELYDNIYDRNIPKYAKKFAKKYKGKSGRVAIDFGQLQTDSVFYVDITPKLKDKIKQGIPLPSAFAFPTTGLMGMGDTQSQDEPTEEKPMTGVLSNIKTWQPDNNLTNFVKMMENAPLAVGKTGVKEYDDVGHRAKGYGTKAGLLAQDTEEEATKAMIKKLIDANKDVDRLVKIKLNKDERNALVSLIYNIGEGAFAKSKALKALNKGDKKTFVKEAFHPKLGFVKSKGKILKGLVNRRTKEKDIFTKGVYGN